MNSSIYECKVMHYRKKDIERRFSYRYFMFYLDIDEIDDISKTLKLFSRNNFNLFSFRDSDYYSKDKPGIRHNLNQILSGYGYNPDELKIKMLTNVSTLGYNFNPVSFYFCFDKTETPICVIPEVGNTFHELKLFHLGKNEFTGKKFHAKQMKYFYVSPFIQHDTEFEFNLYPPEDNLNININDYLEGEKIFNATLTGKRQNLTDLQLLKYFIKYPFVTLKIIGTIHWQALLLYLKKLRFYKKNELSEHQKGMVLKWKKR